ncbi:helix-turn-helix transcriptional regulator [Delftia sp.]|uniref:helix-turn-helix domain-containing protein n=1 Tax=Delftia sp. TaxID=1886637 RepID=UPI00259D11A2|nr:helix-turn-helix transcriptional regulator [Delftia sp.]
MDTSLYHVDYDEIRALLRELRRHSGLTQEQMAVALGVGQSYVSKLERGENFVDVLLYARWCQACGTKPGMALDKLLAGPQAKRSRTS